MVVDSRPGALSKDTAAIKTSKSDRHRVALDGVSRVFSGQLEQRCMYCGSCSFFLLYSIRSDVQGCTKKSEVDYDPTAYFLVKTTLYSKRKTLHYLK